MKKFSFVWVLQVILVAIARWHERHGDVIRGVHFNLVKFSYILIILQRFLVFYDSVCTDYLYQQHINNILLQNTITDVALNTSPNVLLRFNICQFFVIIYLIFAKVGPYVTKNRITFFCTAIALLNGLTSQFFETGFR